MRVPTAVVSIDADFFTGTDEQRLLSPMRDWLRDRVAGGLAVRVADDHVDLVDALPGPVDVVVNFDFHMDLTVPFLLGAPASTAADASVFESVLADGLARTYVWAHPSSRRAVAARVYTSAVLAGRQPLLANIHCVPAGDALPVVADLDVVWAFVCRSPAYATPDTDEAFEELVTVSGSPG